jgi:hypothetical protein
MEPQKMTIHRALSELKLLDSRIEKNIQEIIPSGAYQKGKLINGHIKEEDFQKYCTAKFQTVNDLINRKMKIKSAIVEANGKTMVKVAGRDMTIADAINFKSIIIYKKNLNEVLRSRHQTVLAEINKGNANVEANMQRILEATFGKENVKVSKEDMDAVRKPYMDANEFHLFDPLRVVDTIDKSANEISDFEAEVDAVLSEINATTFIQV